MVKDGESTNYDAARCVAPEDAAERQTVLSALETRGFRPYGRVMGRRGNRRTGPSDTTDWASERTLAEAEEAQTISAQEGDSGVEPCPCGSTEFVLEAFLHVVGGKVNPKPLDIEGLTCPNCGREFEAIEGTDGAILRGEFRGYMEEE